MLKAQMNSDKLAVGLSTEKDKKLYDNTIKDGAKKQWITQAVDNPTANLSEFICALSIYFLQPPLSNILR